MPALIRARGASVSPGFLLGRAARARRGVVLVEPGALNPPLTLTRAQLAGVESSAVAADGGTLGLFGADTARFNGTARRLLIEGQRTNSGSNVRGEGFVAGSPGTVPTGWISTSTGGVVTRTLVARGTQNGRDFVEYQYQFSAAGQANIAMSGNATSAAAGQVWTNSVWLSVVAGSWANINTATVTVAELDAGGAFLVNSTESWLNHSGAPTRYWVTRTLNNASTARLAGDVFINATGAADITFRLSWPQLEQGAFASSAILPPVGTPGASTRGADLVSASLASLGIGGNGACTVLWSGMIPQAAPSGADQTIIQIDDGTPNNRYLLRNNGGGSNVAVFRVTGGTGTGAAVAGALTAGTPFRVGVAIDGAGRVAASMNGGAAVNHTGGPTSGLTTLRLGAETSGALAMFGETLAARVLPYALSDSDLAAAVAALPT